MNNDKEFNRENFINQYEDFIKSWLDWSNEKAPGFTTREKIEEVLIKIGMNKETMAQQSAIIWDELIQPILDKSKAVGND